MIVGPDGSVHMGHRVVECRAFEGGSGDSSSAGGCGCDCSSGGGGSGGNGGASAARAAVVEVARPERLAAFRGPSTSPAAHGLV